MINNNPVTMSVRFRIVVPQPFLVGFSVDSGSRWSRLHELSDLLFRNPSCACATWLRVLRESRGHIAPRAFSCSLSGCGEGKLIELGVGLADCLRPRTTAASRTTIASPLCVALVGVVPTRRSLATAVCRACWSRFVPRSADDLLSTGCVALPDLQARASRHDRRSAANAPATLPAPPRRDAETRSPLGTQGWLSTRSSSPARGSTAAYFASAASSSRSSASDALIRIASDLFVILRHVLHLRFFLPTSVRLLRQFLPQNLSRPEDSRAHCGFVDAQRRGDFSAATFLRSSTGSAAGAVFPEAPRSSVPAPRSSCAPCTV